jgi:TatD DNase family protein
MKLIDTHAHLYVNAFSADREALINRARQAGVARVYLPAIDSETHQALLELEAGQPGFCFAMMGLHPCSVGEQYGKELDEVAGRLAVRPFAAVGEIGLDHYWDKSHVREQLLVFRQQMEWALGYGLPVVIHTRNAMQETIDAVKPFAARGLRGIFHCFSGSLESAVQITGMGFYLGIGGVVTYPKAGLGEVLEQIGLDRLVLETDAPYLTPVPHRGKRNESSYLTYIVQRLAEITRTDIETVAAVTTANAEKIFGS